MNILLPLPPSTNTYYRHVGDSRVVISAEGRAYRKRVGELVASARVRGDIPCKPLTGRVAIGIGFRAPDRKARDLDNIQKPLLDALTHARVWLDDSQVDALITMRGENLIGGAVDVVVTDMAELTRYIAKAA